MMIDDYLNHEPWSWPVRRYRKQGSVRGFSCLNKSG